MDEDFLWDEDAQQPVRGVARERRPRERSGPVRGRVPYMTQPAAGMLFFGYFLSFWVLGGGFAVIGSSPTAAAGELVRYPLLWIAIALGWSADVVTSRRREYPEGGRAIRIGQFRFFHGPVITGVCALSIAIAVWGSLTAV